MVVTDDYRPAAMKLNIGLLLAAALPSTVLARVVPRGDEFENDTPAAKQLANIFAAQKCWTQSPVENIRPISVNQMYPLLRWMSLLYEFSFTVVQSEAIIAKSAVGP
ncbi:hypothetical protein APSETT445_001039 [Aspergillus pseudonomiae]